METQTRQNVTNQRELVITRIFDAPRELVWKMFTEAESLKNWWGPKTFTAPFGKIDFRVGGEYLFDMRGPDGKDYWSKGTYREIQKPERIVATDSFADEKGNTVPASYYGMSGNMPLESLVTMTFEQVENEKTRFTLSYMGIPDEMFNNALAGWNESFDKLAGFLAQYQMGNTTNIVAAPDTQNIVITRLFNAPRDIVFEMYTDPNMVARWWGPRSMTTTVDKLDARAGGEWRYINIDAGGNKSAFHGVFHEVKVPERTVYTFEYEGMPGHVLLETDTFEELDGKTLMTAQLVFQSAQDRDGMLQSGMSKGINESNERFAELLKQKTDSVWKDIPEQ